MSRHLLPPEGRHMDHDRPPHEEHADHTEHADHEEHAGRDLLSPAGEQDGIGEGRHLREDRPRQPTAERPQEDRAGWLRRLSAGWRRYLRAEWTKLRTAPETMWLVVGIVAATVGISLVVVLNIPCSTTVCGGDPTKAGLTGVMLGQAVVAILAVLAVGNEYGNGMIHGTFAAMPRRSGVLAAKAVVVTVVVVPAATVAVTIAALTGRHVLPADASAAAVLRATGGSVLYLVFIGLLALGVATVVRNAAAAVGVVLALLFLFPILAAAAPDPAWERHLLQIGPMTAGLAVQATTGLDKLPIAPWTGLAVTAAWAAGALLAAVIALQARDA